ncbi:MAG TPA: ABC transporter ATP-binding protein [Candidatus Lachnoclostridium stercoripullorum]|uniref:ABC transporter ATP-binding protein n=1 Tax=Candidatus Lachnoclostridium stercoripullorum TaxID=2838635 RepID=A0A9D1W3F7_9FIRM|nr:ABC transporter ATP-binding protein [Candidatus Lachnoclostridium stercoripullorum]
MLEIRDLKKNYGKYQVLNGLDMTVPDGSLFGFVGPNGAGKTTTLKIMVGLLAADGGTVSYDGFSFQEEGWERHVGYVPDFFGVYDNLKVWEYMEFFASCYGLEGLKARKRCSALLEQIGLEDKEEFYVDGLSKGMKQRLCLARALIHDPEVLILDEPMAGLDPRTRFDFRETLKDLSDQGKTIVLSSHVLSELSELCTDVGIIDQGRMALTGSIRDILSQVNSSNPIVITLFGGGTDVALSILKSHPSVHTITVKGREIVVRFSGDEQEEAVLLQRLVDAGLLVSGFTREKGSLESLFMQITDRDEERTVLRYENESGL